ncbi:MAG: hypothetical protein LBB14_00475 [Puniceicoccales bacterium]|jgi:hypothetical protein|nr:hypothetical protein [Puniceicoccales bacterium]
MDATSRNQLPHVVQCGGIYLLVPAGTPTGSSISPAGGVPLDCRVESNFSLYFPYSIANIENFHCYLTFIFSKIGKQPPAENYSDLIAFQGEIIKFIKCTSNSRLDAACIWDF